MRSYRQLVFVCAAVLSAGALSPVDAQHRGVAQQRVPPRPLPVERQRGPVAAPTPNVPRAEVNPHSAGNDQRPEINALPPNGARPGANTLPPRAFQRLQNMTPDQQERFLRNNRRFQNLPEDQQSQIRQRLGAWNKLTPDQQQELRVRQRIWERLTPEQRSNIQQVLLPQWQQLSPDRQKAIMQRLHTLRDMTEHERNAKLDDPMFVQGLNADDRDMLRQFAHLHVGMAPDPAGF